ncbi:hypothetical protein CDL15_Pgr000386 [Punica granatum]|nr:hypothetical protein CDL15_Pgr000386 [Punica granatum]
MGGEEESGDRGQRFLPLSAAATARGGAGDGGDYRLGYAVLGRGVTRIGKVGVERIFEFFGAISRFSGKGFLSLIAGNRAELRGVNGGLLCRSVSQVDSRGKSSVGSSRERESVLLRESRSRVFSRGVELEREGKR